MSMSAMMWVWTHSRSKNGARLVLLAIADVANDNSRNAWPSVKTLKTKANLSERSVQNAIKELVELGELKVGWNEGPKGSNLYSIVMRSTPAESAPPQDLHPADSAGVENESESDTSVPDPPQNLHPAGSAPPQNSTPTPAESAPEPKENPTPKKKTSSSSSGTRGTRIPDDFAMTPEMIDWGRENFPHLNGDAVTAEFVDYWRAVPGAKGVKLDWPATWRNWIRRKGENGGPVTTRGASPGPGPRPSTADQRVAQAYAAAEQLKAELRARRSA